MTEGRLSALGQDLGTVVPVDYAALAQANGATSSVPATARMARPGSDATPPVSTAGPAASALGPTVGASMRIARNDPGAVPNPTSATPNGPSASQNAQQYLQSLLASGMDPNQAIQQVNQVYGLGYGSSAVYYGPGAHGAGSGAVIGIDGFGGYFSQNSDGSWGWVTSPEQSSVNIGGGPGVSPSTSSAVPAGLSSLGTTTGSSLVAGSPSYTAFAPWDIPFVAPSAAEAAQYPGYQFQLDQGLQAVQRSAAANGTLLTGGTLKDLENYGQGLASTDYTNVYNQALGEYQQAYNIYNQNQASQFNRLASVAGLGQIAAGQLGSQGMTLAGLGANSITNAGQATASGILGSSNAWQTGLTNIGNTATGLATLPYLTTNTSY